MNVTPITPPSVQSVGPGGQIYISNLFTGFIIRDEQQNDIFTFNQNDPQQPFARVLTNFVETGKIGSRMTYTAGGLAIRIFKLGATAPTAQELHDVKKLLASSRVEVNIASNNTKVAEFSGTHFMNVLDVVGKEATANFVPVGTVNSSGYCNLRIPIALEENINLGGVVRFGIPVPASLRQASEEWAFVVLLAGEKSAK
jgi:hypothetical protein